MWKKISSKGLPKILKRTIGSTKVKGNSIATDNIANNCLNYLNNNNYYLNRTSQQKKSPNNNDGRNNEEITTITFKPIYKLNQNYITSNHVFTG